VGNHECFCVFRHNGETAQLLRARARSPEAFARACASVAAQSGVTHLRLFNESRDSMPAVTARALQWTIVHEQAEMRVLLAPAPPSTSENVPSE
jgi:hypothetical protein